MTGNEPASQAPPPARRVRVRRRSAHQPPKGAFDSSGGAAAAKARAARRQAVIKAKAARRQAVIKAKAARRRAAIKAKAARRRAAIKAKAARRRAAKKAYFAKVKARKRKAAAARQARIKAHKAKMKKAKRLTGCVAPNGRRNSAGEYGSPWWNTSRCTSQRAAWIQMRRSKKKKRGRPTRVSGRPKKAGAMSKARAKAKKPLTMSQVRALRASKNSYSARMKAKGCVYRRSRFRWKRGWKCPRKKVKKVFKWRRRGGRRRRRCFSPETLIKLHNGETRAMKNIQLGDILINGSTVTATMQIKNENDPYYKIHSEDLNTDILVTGSHYIQSSARFIRVSKFNGSVATQKIDPVVNCIITSDHKVPIGEYIFWDWEDQYVN